MTLLKHHYGNNLLARGDNFLNLGSDESDLDLMAAEYFTKLRNEDLPQVKIERHEALSKLWQKAKLCSKIPFRPVLYSNNEVCSEEEPVNAFGYDNEEKAPSLAISSEEQDALLSEFCGWLKSTNGEEKNTCAAAEKHTLVLMSIVRYDQEQLQINYNNLFDSGYLNKYLLYQRTKNRKPGTLKTYLNSVNHFYNFAKICKNEINRQFLC